MLAILAASLLQPKLAYRWLYIQSNFQVAANEQSAEALLDRAAKVGYNGVVLADSKIERLASVPPIYFENVRRFLAKARSLRIDVYPAMAGVGYAEGMLYNNPDLAESQPVRGTPLVVRQGQAVVAPNPAESFRNGGFEAANGNAAVGMGFQDKVGSATFIDRGTVHGGSASLRFENPGAGNCRVMQEIPVTPHRQYHLSAWIKSSNFRSPFEIKVLDGEGRLLNWQASGASRTQDWKRTNQTFNSGDSKVARIYFGVWGGGAGSLWLDDVAVEECAFVNMVRRPNCPLTVRGSDGRVLAEGRDFAKLVDPKAGRVQWPGDFDAWHEPPILTALPGGSIREGERLTADWNAAVVMPEGQVSICLSDVATKQLMFDSAARVAKLFDPKGIFLSHDEIRCSNWCDGCQALGLTAGALLARNFNDAIGAVQAAKPNIETFVWNDMFDPNHNAVDHYYLTRGNLAGSWNGVPRNTVIVNWYFGARSKSGPFWSSRGNRQILAGFYDGDPRDIRTWLEDLRGVDGIVGAMYTTWRNDFSQLESFARFAWGS